MYVSNTSIQTHRHSKKSHTSTHMDQVYDCLILPVRHDIRVDIRSQEHRYGSHYLTAGLTARLTAMIHSLFPCALAQGKWWDRPDPIGTKFSEPCLSKTKENDKEEETGRAHIKPHRGHRRRNREIRRTPSVIISQVRLVSNERR